MGSKLTYPCNFIIGSKKYKPEELSSNEFNERLEKRGVKTKFINGDRYEAILKLGIILGDLEK